MMVSRSCLAPVPANTVCSYLLARCSVSGSSHCRVSWDVLVACVPAGFLFQEGWCPPLVQLTHMDWDRPRLGCVAT